jgi:NADPH:quinone reductase-like Zn-dependent oxidoreductase
MRGVPYPTRFVAGWPKPKNHVPGFDGAGNVEAVGKNVTRLRPGDEVFGMCGRACAEYACAPEATFALKPANLTFEQAAAVPTSAFAALQGLRDAGKVRPGQKVLINGASGGVGTFAVQIAKSFGAEVTGVCSTRNVEMVRSIGADHVIDYTKEDFTRTSQHYDLILDMVGNHSLLKLRRVLRPEGKYIMVGGRSGRWIAPFPRALSARMLSWFVSQDMRFFVAQLNKEDLTTLHDLMQAGKVTPVIDRRYSLSEAPEAIRYLEAGHARGKVIIAVD